MTLVMFPPHVLGPKYERRQRPRDSQEFRIGRSRGNLAMTPDVAVVISLNRFWAPVDDTVTAHSKTQVTSRDQVKFTEETLAKSYETKTTDKPTNLGF